MSDIHELNRKKVAALEACRAILDAADKEGRTKLTAEEQEKYDRAWADYEGLKDRVQKELELRKGEQAAAEPGQRQAGGMDQPGDGDGHGADPAEKEKRRAFQKLLRGGIATLSSEEVRALQADSDTAGGYMVMPQIFATGLIKAADDLVFIRPLAQKYEVATAQSLGIRCLKADPADADWTPELGTGSEDSTMEFGKRELYPHQVAKLIKVSNKLLRLAPDVEGLVRDRLNYKFGITEEKAFMTGSGAQQPLGMFTASDDGISTSRDYNTDMTATSLSCDGLIGAKYTLKGQYHRNARWLFHRDGVAQIAKLKDGTGEYIWRESLRVGEPDRLLAFPVLMSEYCPNTFTASQYVGMLGDFNHYAIADALDMRIQRLVELYAETNQVGFIALRDLDGMPVLEEAFVRLKLAAS